MSSDAMRVRLHLRQVRVLEVGTHILASGK